MKNTQVICVTIVIQPMSVGFRLAVVPQCLYTPILNGMEDRDTNLLMSNWQLSPSMRGPAGSSTKI